jgi:diguanylate cyclase (GGDEF)-like protein/PAS domain S-box-containing protein
MIKWFSRSEAWKGFNERENTNIGQKLLHDLYMHTKISLTTLLGLSILFFVLLVGNVSGKFLYPWFFIALILNVSRLYDSYRYLHHNHQKTYKQWYEIFTYKSYLTAFLWGSISLLFLPQVESEELRSIIFLFVIGIGSGAMTSISPDIRTAATYLFLLIAPLFVYFVLQGDSTNYILAFILVAYYFLLVNVSRNIGDSLINSYRQEERYRESQKELYAKQDELNSLFKNAPIGIMYADTNYNVVDCNVAYSKIFKRKTDELIGMNLKDVPDQRPIQALKQGVRKYSGPYNSVLGYSLWIEGRFSPLMNSNGKKIGNIVLIEDKTTEKRAIDELNYMVEHDDLPPLKNRRSFMEYMKALAKNRKHQDYFSVLFYLDLDQFKTINDTMGHSVGDQLLKQVAKRLQPLAEGDSILSRLGGDEFGIVLPFVATNREEAKTRADFCSRKLQKVFASAFLIEEMYLYIKCSIGIVIIEPKMSDAEEIIRYADISMYSAKRKGRSAVAYYSPSLDVERKALFGLQHDLYHAIETNQLKLYYQPIVSIKDNSMKAAEALLRWHHPKLGVLPPDRFISLAIESGLIGNIGFLVIDNACKQIAEWKTASLFTMEYVSINVSAIQFQRVNFVEKFMEKLEKYGVHPEEIKLEITESSLIDNFEQARGTIEKLKNKGIQCAIDDFGTGYSSLSYLRKFSFSVLKIDREFVKDIPGKTDNTFLLKSIITIGKKLGYQIIIEGIETEEQKNLLKEMDDSLRYQGFLYSQALTAEAFRDKMLK